MKHPSTRQLFDYWCEIRGDRRAPERNEVEPGPIRRILADTFILGSERDYRFRIAGTRICAAFGRELRGESFVDLWEGQSRREVQELLGSVAAETIGLVASASALNDDGCKLEFEWLALPLSQRLATDARVVGVLAPTDMPYWLGVSALEGLTLGSFRFLQLENGAVAAVHPHDPQVARIRRGLVVYQGGRH
jgi:hypothetical protein